jgi:hypothetical protein
MWIHAASVLVGYVAFGLGRVVECRASEDAA